MYSSRLARQLTCHELNLSEVATFENRLNLGQNYALTYTIFEKQVSCAFLYLCAYLLNTDVASGPRTAPLASDLAQGTPSPSDLLLAPT